VIKEFKQFIAKGNLIDLAVAFVLGVAFAAVVTAFTNIVLGGVAYIFGASASFDDLWIHKGTAQVIPYGAFLTALLSFVIVAFAMFLVVKAYNRFRKEEAATTKPCEFCRTDIPLDATRCPNCTSDLSA
jgi:large conductance mechanosensitive channel